MNAADLLDGHDTAALRVRLLPVHPEQVAVRPLSAPLLPRWVAAITLPWAIYVRHEILAERDSRLARLMVHELVHSRQWKTYGTFGFLSRYLSAYLAGRLARLGHREAYRRIRLEQEAARMADHT